MQKPEDIVWQGEFLSMVKRGSWEYAKRFGIKGIVAIVPVTPEGKLVLIDQYRPPANQRVIEMPAGVVGDVEGHEDESLENAAQRELIEETGYSAGKLTRLCHGLTTPGMSDEEVVLYLGWELTRVGAGGGDDSENITVHEIDVTQAHAWLQQRMEEGFNIDVKIYSALYFLGQHLSRG